MLVEAIVAEPRGEILRRHLSIHIEGAHTDAVSPGNMSNGNNLINGNLNRYRRLERRSAPKRRWLLTLLRIQSSRITAMSSASSPGSPALAEESTICTGFWSVRRSGGTVDTATTKVSGSIMRRAPKPKRTYCRAAWATDVRR